MIAKVYTLTVTVQAGSRPNPAAMRPEFAMSVPAFSESFTVNVEAPDLEVAREAALARGREHVPEILQEWKRQHDRDAAADWMPHGYQPPEPADDVDVSVRFEDLVVGMGAEAR